MMFNKAISLAALLALATASPLALRQENGTDIEIVNGYKFVKSGPKVLAPKIVYERPTFRTALDLLKNRLGPDGLIDLLQPDIKEADAFWHDVIDSSTGKWV